MEEAIPIVNINDIVININPIQKYQLYSLFNSFIITSVHTNIKSPVVNVWVKIEFEIPRYPKVDDTFCFSKIKVEKTAIKSMTL